MAPTPLHDRSFPDRAAPSLQDLRRLRVYSLERKEDGRVYVGRTALPLAERLKLHVRAAMRRPARSAPGSLASAVRQVILCGFRLEAAFRWESLAEGLDAAEAGAVQRQWIERLGSWQPRGFNEPPNQAPRRLGVGPVVVHRPQGAETFPSLADAIALRNRERHREGRPPLATTTVRARLMALWSLAEALECTFSGDPAQRPFLDRDFVLQRLREVSALTGLPVDVLRARVRRAAGAGLGMHGAPGEQPGDRGP
jgi:hypothetical protein